MSLCVRIASPSDYALMLNLWERSVRATHGFLGESDIETLRPLVAEEFAAGTIDWWLLVDDDKGIVGFLGYSSDCIEGLFIEPDFRSQGGGTVLVAHAEALATGRLRVDVNEQNDAARGFYEAMGFAVVGRSATDGGGRPFPLLHMTRVAKSPLPSSEATT